MHTNKNVSIFTTSSRNFHTNENDKKKNANIIKGVHSHENFRRGVLLVMQCRSTGYNEKQINKTP
jgi:hypothetical protein